MSLNLVLHTTERILNGCVSEAARAKRPVGGEPDDKRDIEAEGEVERSTFPTSYLEDEWACNNSLALCYEKR